MARNHILVSAVFMIVALAGSLSVEGPIQSPQAFIVGFHADPPVDVGSELLGAKVTHVNDAIDFVRVEAGDGAAFAAAAADGGFRYVQPDAVAVTLFVPNDPLFGDQWGFGDGIAATEATTAWDTTRGGGATVAVLDTGYDTDHPDLPAATGQDFTGEGDIEDCDGHGTHVAGTVAALTDNGVGVAGMSDADILVGRVLDCSGSGSFTWLANAIVWAADSGADVISMSLGCSAAGCFHQATSDALAYAEGKGTLNVCAAGNSGPKKDSVEFPGNDAGCMAVSNLAEGGLSFSSSTGPEVEIAAPGSGIVSTYAGGGYASLSGTSMAAPHVSGVAALVKAVDPGLTGQQIRQILKDSALDSSLDADQEGSGILKASAAVALAGGGGSGGNNPPSAAFTYTATDLSVAFDGTGSSDPDGDALTYTWDFGDGNGGSGATPSHTYAADGTYTVTLTVDDGQGGADSTSQDVTVGGASGDGIQASGNGYKVKGVHHVDITWSGATADVDIVRDGSVVATTANDGEYTDATGNKGGGSYTYEVCETGTSTCSAPFTVVF